MSKKTIGVLTPLTDGFYYNGMLRGIHLAGREHNVNIVYIQTFDSIHANQYHRYVASENVDGWIVLLNAVTDPEHITQLEGLGKPIVSTPNSAGFTHCTTFVIDNEQGGYEATLHMISHGHRKIAFVRCLANEESVLRYQGYLRALKEHNIIPDDNLVYDVPNLWDKYGKDTAAEMMQRGFGFTALVVSSDLTTMCIMEGFETYGIRVPEDVALFSFDNTDFSKRFLLSSVEQPLVDRGQRMCELLIKQIDGTADLGQFVIDRMELVIRRSCGCNLNIETESIDTMYHNALQMNDYLSNVIQRNHHIGQNLIKSDQDEIRNLSWLAFTPFSWGCLALWTGNRQLRIDNIFSDKREAPLHIGEQFTEATFPPAKLHDIVNTDECLTIHTIRTVERDFGFIVLIGDMFDKNRNSNLGPLIHSITHTLDLLAHALEREALYEEARQREHRLEIVSSTTNDGIFDWHLGSNMMEWNRQINHILDHEGLTMQADEFIRRIHPEDLSGLHTALQKHYHDGTTFQQEFRMLKKQDEYIWISAAGEAIRNQEGTPIRMIGAIVDITERKESEENIHFIAYHDALTGLPNRRYMYDRLAEELTRSDKPLAVIMLDLDRFKVVNDSLGHLIGDQLLCQIARVLQSAAGPYDTVARLGGDEFIILCTRMNNQDHAEHIAKSILRALNVPLNIENHLVYATPSIGISFFPEHGTDRETLIQHADIAMYQAKERGKNRFHIYSEEMDNRSLQKLTMESCLRGALAANEFELHYQPQIELATGNVLGMEALIRWSSPVFGKVAPNDFIPLAEETGIIIPISRWVLRQACSDNKHLLDEGYPPLMVSVNISSVHIAEPDFVKTVTDVLELTGLPPHLLCLELTERAAVQRMEQTIAHMKELMSLGVRIALDDFGVGNSSLSLIKALPLDIIKIDRTFVKDIQYSEISNAIFHSILGLIDDLKLVSCVEGIEIQEQYDLTRQQQCEMAQGYHICRPIPLPDLRSYLAKER